MGRGDNDNRMELVAVTRGLRALNEPCEVEIVTDSQYVQRGMSSGWNDGGLPIGKRAWRPVANRDLEERIAGT